MRISKEISGNAVRRGAIHSIPRFYAAFAIGILRVETKGTQLFDLIRTNSFDHDGRLITVTAPVPATGVAAPVTSYSWDSLSRLSSSTDALGNVTSYGHDNAGELTSVTAPVPATGVAAPVTTYAFDGLGREITEVP